MEMKSGEALLPSSGRGKTQPGRNQHRFTTIEERRLRKHGSAAPYFRTQDSLCDAFLHLATDPREFEGLKLLFPFVREAVLLRIPQTDELLASWMHGAFSAGHDLGRAHPDLLEAARPGQELCRAVRHVGLISRLDGLSATHRRESALQHNADKTGFAQRVATPNFPSLERLRARLGCARLGPFPQRRHACAHEDGLLELRYAAGNAGPDGA
jgi:hypothetical protein